MVHEDAGDSHGLRNQLNVAEPASLVHDILGLWLYWSR